MFWNPIERVQQRLARRRYMPRTRVAKTGTIGKVSLAALGVIVAVSAVLELSGNREGEQLGEYLRQHGVPPLDLVERAALRRRLVIVADIPGSVVTKRFFADAVERVSHSSGLDLVGLEVDAAEQRYIDAYLSTDEEDVGILLGRPRAIREHEGMANAYLAIYRRVRQLNDGLSADRRIRILALDAEDWPPARALPPQELARRFGQRDSVMSARMQQTLSANPRTRTLLFVGGLSALRGASGLVQTGGTRSIQASWFAGRLARLYPQDVFCILTDAPAAAAARVLVASYRGTTAGPLLAENYSGPSAGVPLRTGPSFPRRPIRVAATPGIIFDFAPANFDLADVADAYLYLGH